MNKHDIYDFRILHYECMYVLIQNIVSVILKSIKFTNVCHALSQLRDSWLLSLRRVPHNRHQMCTDKTVDTRDNKLFRHHVFAILHF